MNAGGGEGAPTRPPLLPLPFPEVKLGRDVIYNAALQDLEEENIVVSKLTRCHVCTNVC